MKEGNKEERYQRQHGGRLIAGVLQSVVILSCLRNAIMPKSCFRRLCHSNFVNTLLYIAIFGTIPRVHRHRNLPQFLFKQSSASICTTVPKISNKSLLEFFFPGPLEKTFAPFWQMCHRNTIGFAQPLCTAAFRTTIPRNQKHTLHHCTNLFLQPWPPLL